MSILAFKINLAGNLPIQTQAKTLDELTQSLPQGFYTTFSTLSNGTKVLGLRAHLQRLRIPALEQGLASSLDEPTLRIRIAEIAKMCLPKESRIRLILTKDDGAIYAGIQPFEPIAKSVYENGVQAVTAELTRQSPRVKDTGFISSSIDQRKQVGKDVFEVLLTRDGKILEGITSNFYAIKGKTLVTAQSGILLGVTRRVILRLARGEGMSIRVAYRAPKIGEKFDEAFLTSSSRGVVPIVSIDDKPVGQGRVGKGTQMLSKAYQAYVEERSERIVG
jgi:branched-chain amino acid aminotransferase